MKQFILIVLYIISVSSFGQDNGNCYAEKEFLLILSTKSYQSALKTAREASKKLNLKLDLRGLKEDTASRQGLTLQSDTCIKLTKQFGISDSTCYLARGKWDDGIYISIEYSNSYNSFTNGYYIVMVGSSFKQYNKLKKELPKVRKTYKDAYIKTSKVYMCCSH